MDNYKVILQSAIADFKSGVYPSIWSAAAAYKVNWNTLGDRIHGKSNWRDISHQSQLRLAASQEEELSDWILSEDERGYPPSHARTREMATFILHANGDTKPLGRKWITNYLCRNPRVASIVGRRIEAARSRSCTREEIQAFFNRLDCTRRAHNVHNDDIWNMDEHGLGLGVCTNSRVLASSKKKRAYISGPQDCEWVSILETMSTAGKTTRPLVIFKGVNL